MKKTFLTLSLVATMFGLAPFAGATLLAPGGSVLPASVAGPAIGDTLVGSVNETFTGLLVKFSGTFIEDVYRNASGTLDFYFQIQNSKTSTDNIDRGTSNGFGSFKTDVYYDATQFGAFGSTTCGVAPTASDRSGGVGDTVAFVFGSPGLIAPGCNSDIFVVKTDATSLTNSTFQIIDGDISLINDLAPSAVPEPASIVLFGSVLGLTGLIMRRKRAAKESKEE